MSTEQQESHRLLTVPEVAEQLRLSKGTVYKLIRDGVVPAVQLGESVPSDGRMIYQTSNKREFERAYPAFVEFGP